jgi:hypothetical protein
MSSSYYETNRKPGDYRQYASTSGQQHNSRNIISSNFKQS